MSLVFDKLSGSPPTFYVDNLRLVGGGTEEVWDDMDSDSRQWFYFGNWFDWAPGRLFGLEAVSHNGANPTSPAGPIYLQWDYQNGCCYPETKAEIGAQKLDGLTDWSGYTRLVADVKISNPNAPVSVFFWDADAQNGHVVPAQKVAAADTWQTISWDLNWPAGFNSAGIDEIKFVVQDIDLYPTGTLYLDNILLLPSSVPTLTYIFENCNYSASCHFERGTSTQRAL